MTQILLLDDNADIVALMCIALEKQGYDVTAGRNGADGVTLLSQPTFRPDVIISNLMMPIMDGLAFLGQVRHHPSWLSIPFVLMTAASSEDRRQAAFDHGANAFLAKPFKFSELYGTLTSLGFPPD